MASCGGYRDFFAWSLLLLPLLLREGESRWGALFSNARGEETGTAESAVAGDDKAAGGGREEMLCLILLLLEVLLLLHPPLFGQAMNSSSVS